MTSFFFKMYLVDLCLIFLTTMTLITFATDPSHSVKDLQNSPAAYDPYASSLYSLTTFLRNFGLAWRTEVPHIDRLTVNLFTTEMVAKEGCRWTKEDKKRWDDQLQKIKGQIKGQLEEEEEGDNDDMDFFSLAEYKTEKGKLTDLANYTLSMVDNFQIFLKAFDYDADSDFVLLKFVGFLRENMLLRQQKFPSCDWTDDDRERAEKRISEIFDQFNALINQGVSKATGESSSDDRIAFAGEGDRTWWLKIYGTLFEPFPTDQEEEVTISPANIRQYDVPFFPS